MMLTMSLASPSRQYLSTRGRGTSFLPLEDTDHDGDLPIDFNPYAWVGDPFPGVLGGGTRKTKMRRVMWWLKRMTPLQIH